MPPYKTGSKAWHIENDTNEERLWGVLFENRKLRQEINALKLNFNELSLSLTDKPI